MNIIHMDKLDTKMILEGYKLCDVCGPTRRHVVMRLGKTPYDGTHRVCDKCKDKWEHYPRSVLEEQLQCRIKLGDTRREEEIRAELRERNRVSSVKRKIYRRFVVHSYETSSYRYVVDYTHTDGSVEQLRMFDQMNKAYEFIHQQAEEVFRIEERT